MQFIELCDHYKPKALFIHGAYGDGASVLPLAEKLKDLCDPVLIELDGHGQSDRHDYFSTRQEAEGIVKYMDHIKEPIVLLYGASLGAQIGLEVLAERPDRIDFAVLEGGRYRPSLGEAVRQTNAFALARQRHQVRSKKYWLKRAKIEGYSEEMALGLFASSRRVGKDNARRMMRSWYMYDVGERARLEAIRTQVRFYCAEDEMAGVLSSSEEMAGYIPQAELCRAKGYHAGLLARCDKTLVDYLRNILKSTSRT